MPMNEEAASLETRDNFDEAFDQLMSRDNPAVPFYSHKKMAHEFAEAEESNLRHARNNR